MLPAAGHRACIAALATEAALDALMEPTPSMIEALHEATYALPSESEYGIQEVIRAAETSTRGTRSSSSVAVTSSPAQVTRTLNS